MATTTLPISSVTTTSRSPQLIQYTKHDFDAILNDGFVYRLDAETIKIIQTISEQVGAPEYIKTPQFEKKNGINYDNINDNNNVNTNYYDNNNMNTNDYNNNRPSNYNQNYGQNYDNRHNKQQNNHYGKNGYNNHHKQHKYHKQGHNNLKIKEITDEDWEAIRKFQATVIAKKEGVDASIDQIRKHLNKMTTKTYDTLKNKIIDEIKSITDDTNPDSPEIIEELNKIGDALFNIASGNSFYSEMYATLYKELMESFSINDADADNANSNYSSNFMETIFKTNFVKFNTLFEKFDYCDPVKDYDAFCNNNKINEKRRAISLFYVNLMKLDMIQPNDIITIIQGLQQTLLDTIKLTDSKNITDELSEILFILITNSSSKMKSLNNDSWNTIIDSVKEYSKKKTNPELIPSITNKSIFKHMDIIDAIKK